MSDFARNIKRRRAERGMSQEQLAEKLGVSRQAVSKWENGTSDPSTSNLLAIARLYGVSAEELLRSAGDGGKQRKESGARSAENSASEGKES